MGQNIAASLVQSLGHMFDFTENYEIGGRTFQLYGRYYRRNSRYFAVKKVEIYGFSNFEHIFFHRVDGHFSERDFDSLIAHFKLHTEQIVSPNHEHMSSLITLIVECNTLDEELIRKIGAFKYKKSFKFGFWGWVDMKVLVVERSGNRTVESRTARGDAERLKLI